jgi:uncharacterized protein YgiM (DUF1202 family)
MNSKNTMKNLIGAAMIAGLMILVLTGNAMAGNKFLYVKSNAANIRAIPSIQSEVLATAAFGDRLYSVEHIGDWYQVKLEDGRMGFIYDELVTDHHPEQLYVDVPMANVRQLNNVYSPVLTTAEAGTELKSLGKKDDWYKVKLADGTVGFIYEDLVDDDPPGILFVDVMTGTVQTSPSPVSESLLTVKAGDELKKVMKFDDYYQVKLDDGRTGFIHEDMVTSDAPDKLFVDVPVAELKTDPTIYGVLVTTVKGGAELTAFDKDDDFYLVKTADGTLGWIYDENVIKMSD